MQFNFAAQSTIRNCNAEKAQTISLTSQHKVELETLTLQQKKAQLGTIISQHNAQLETLKQQKQKHVV